MPKKKTPAPRRVTEASADCWVHCPDCQLDFRLGVSVPCSLELYIAALKIIRCPQCGKKKTLQAYSPGVTPAEARRSRSYEIRL